MFGLSFGFTSIISGLGLGSFFISHEVLECFLEILHL